MASSREGGELNQEIFDAVTELLKQTLERTEKIADELAVPQFCVKALHQVNESVTMKELGKRMRCDPSFVTAIADSLEQRGLVRREPSPADRRIKNLVLTSDGRQMKSRLEGEILSQMPWCQTLDANERRSFLALIRKMIKAGPSHAVPAAGTAGAARAAGAAGTAARDARAAR